jgi:hypothetical protein
MQNNKLKQQNSPAGHAVVNLDLQVPGNFQHWPLFHWILQPGIGSRAYLEFQQQFLVMYV